MKQYLTIFCALYLMAGLTGCLSVKVQRVEVDERIDLSGEWNDYDAMRVSENMVEDALKHPWHSRFIKEHGRDPIVIVGHVKNRSAEHINASVFVKHLERELLNSGRVIFVASTEERKQMREEREDQQAGHTDQDSMAVLGKESGADYMLIGSINLFGFNSPRLASF